MGGGDGGVVQLVECKLWHAVLIGVGQVIWRLGNVHINIHNSSLQLVNSAT